MKQFNARQIKILQELAKGQCLSGAELGNALGVSRTAIWKHIKQLAELGVPVCSLPQKGYQLSLPIHLLNEACILSALPVSSLKSELQFHFFASIDSTNRFLKNIPSDRYIHVCCAETQTEGRGRFGRHWHSPFGENIYCSSRWHFFCDPSQLSGLSLTVSLAIYAALKSLNLHSGIQVKWPNDLLWQDKKLSGCLIEMNAESNGMTEVIIGIGINVNATGQHKAIQQPWCSLYDITSAIQDRNAIVASLLLSLDNYLKRFSNSGFQPFLQEWNQLDYLKGKQVTVNNHSGNIQGMAQGINEQGQLVLKDAFGHTHVMSSGDTTLGI